LALFGRYDFIQYDQAAEVIQKNGPSARLVIVDPKKSEHLPDLINSLDCLNPESIFLIDDKPAICQKGLQMKQEGIPVISIHLEQGPYANKGEQLPLEVLRYPNIAKLRDNIMPISKTERGF